MKPLAELLLGIGVYVLLLGSIVVGGFAMAFIIQRLWDGSCIA